MSPVGEPAQVGSEHRPQAPAPPTARFTRTPDGSRVAYAACGEGPPLVMVPGWLCHLEQSWSHPAAASARAKLATGRRFVSYDRLGCGLSDRDGFELSLESDVDQLVAVLDAAGIGRADLIGYSFGAPPAALFAARFPDRVGRVVFYSAFARGSAITNADRIGAFQQIVRSDWGVGSRTLASLLLPNAGSEDLRWFSRFQRAATTGETAAALLGHLWSMDVREHLPRIRAPALILHNRHDRAIPLAAGEEVAALVPDARLRLLDGNEHDPFIRDSGAVVEAILDFVGGRPIRPDPVRTTRHPRAPELTAREREVLGLIASGAPNKRIASVLEITTATVERHVTNLYRKLGAGGRADATRCAVAMGLTSATVPH